jgi:archaellum biogenesis ATPase FlaH
MDSKKQRLLIEYLISSTDTFALCQNIVDPTYFDPEFRQAVTFVKTYYDEYSSTPSPAQIEAESGQKFEIRNVQPDEIKYCSTEIEKFCKHSAMRKASNALPALINEEKYAEAEEMVKAAVMVSLTNELGLRYFEDIDGRIQRMLTENKTNPTYWSDVDEALFGGISRKELLLVSANSGGGKSLTLANLAFNYVINGLNVLYISLELDEDIVAQRFDTMFTGISRKIWKDKADEVSTRLHAAAEKENTGVLDIIQMPSGTTAHQIRAYLKEFNLHYNMLPDLLILDYLDNMNPNERVSADNVFEKDKRSSEQLRQIGVDYNMYIATASQLNRSAVGAVDHDHSQIAGGISKINVADVYWSIIFTEQMRAMKKIIFILQKTRNSDGLGRQIHLKWEPRYLRIVDEENDNNKPDFSFDRTKTNTSEECTTTNHKNDLLSDEVPKEEKEPNKPTGDKLADMLTSISI